MVSGSIVKIVDTFGSQWGHVRPAREPRQLFFNVDSLVEGVDFSTLAVGVVSYTHLTLPTILRV